MEVGGGASGVHGNGSGGGGGFTGYRRTISPSNSGMSIGIGLTVPIHPADGAAGGNAVVGGGGPEDECTVREQDRFMPIANVIRIMRKILPPHAKISDEAKETIQECVSEYISFITGEANERCQREQRKTITAEDVLWAMSKLGFDDYIEPLTLYLHRRREFDGGERDGSSSSSLWSEAMGKRPATVEHPAVTTLGIIPPGTCCYEPGMQQPHFHLGQQPPAEFFTAPPPPLPVNGFLSSKNNHSSSNGGGPSSQAQSVEAVEHEDYQEIVQCKKD